MAEIELSVLSRQCLAGRILDRPILVSKAGAWEAERSGSVVKVHWRFTTADARIKLKSLFPKIEV
jgi:hypothetical protein